jgi:FtsP/CotA-like multicopper oxidase with cupredoxin domain
MELPAERDLKPFRPESIAKDLVKGQQRVVYSIALDPLRFLVNGQPYDASRTRRLRLGNVEQWVVLSSNPDADVPVVHPFHIHTNPFEIVSILNGAGEEVLDEPIWRDTVALPEGWRITLRMRYDRYIGTFVHHCHILDHEDQGMMEQVEIAP